VAGAADGENDVLVLGMRVDDEVVVGALLVEARLVTDPRANAAGEELVEEWPEMRFVFRTAALDRPAADRSTAGRRCLPPL
jgi:hypothetical protein